MSGKLVQSFVAGILLMLVTSGAASCAPAAPPIEPGKIYPGSCDYVRLTVISELGWKDGTVALSDIAKAGGMGESQWEVDWTPGNDLGSCQFLEAKAGGKVTRILVDAGWNVDYMKERFKACGIDLKKVDLVYITHEHMDHFWGLPGVLKERPDVTLMVPGTFSDIAKAKIKEWGHTGKLIATEPNKMYTQKEIVELPKGAVSILFPGLTLLGIDGEQSLYFNVKDRGLVCVTGCCHQGIMTFLGFAEKNLQFDNENWYGLAGGLHISLLGEWSPVKDQLLDKIQACDFEIITSNHCTGNITYKKMIDRGMPALWLSDGWTAEFGKDIKVYDETGRLVKKVEYKK